MKDTIKLEEINMLEVKSSNISKIGYDKNILIVEFKNGGKYIYVGVEEDQYNNMMNCESIGKYFINNIRKSDKYTCFKL